MAAAPVLNGSISAALIATAVAARNNAVLPRMSPCSLCSGLPASPELILSPRNGKRNDDSGYVDGLSLELSGRSDVRVRAGVDVSSGCFLSKPTYPPEDAFWAQAVPPRPGAPEDALDLLGNSIASGATVLAIGPYTNLAALEHR